MSHVSKSAFRAEACSRAAVTALCVALLATPALAQDPGAPRPTPPAAGETSNGPASPGRVDAAAAPNATAADQDIIVTGTLFRRTDVETPSPVTVLTADNLAKAGITNVADAIRSISADNSGSIPTAFSNGFGSGSAAVSLRGLSVNSTLVLINGIRTANYPYADDGQRAFVDLNSIPQSTIERIEVLKDGASSSYGADAIGGVVNIITKKQVVGIEGTVEGGVSQRKDGGEQRLTLTGGYGDLDTQGFNVYLNGEYQHNSLIGVADRGFPYNTADLSGIGGDDNNNGALGAFATRAATDSAVVRPATQSVPGNIFSGVAVPGGLTRVLNPAGCGGNIIAHTDDSGSYCEQNANLRGTIQPAQTRYGGTAHASARFGDVNAYLEGTYYHSRVFSEQLPWTIRQRNPINTTNIVLPALLANGTPNPNDPYAAQGLVAQIAYQFGDLNSTTTTRNDVYRIAGGVNGSFGNGFDFTLDGTYARSTLTGTNTGYLNIAGLTNAINTGSYNFVNPALNSQAVRDAISPAVSTTAKTQLYMIEGTVTKALVDLPGGPLQVAIGGSARRETLNNPNANATQATLGLNAVTASGKRTVTAGYFEINAPVFKQLEINGSGRYDHYSDGFSHFSPKIGAKFTPIKQLALRGTFSKGFRAPSFAEKNNGAVIGYTSATPPCSVILQHGGTGDINSCSGGDAYVKSYSLGYNTASNPNLKPELSRSFTGGAVIQPVQWLSLTVDYYNIKKTRVITGGPLAGQAIAAYYAGTALPAGYSVVLDDADATYPNAIRRVVQVNSPYENAAALKTSGLDMAAQAQLKVRDDIKFTSRIEVTDIFNYDFKPSPDAPYDNYVGTQAPYILSSGAGTPKWRGNWMNSIEAGRITLTGTAYYTSGYRAVAEDQNGHGATTCDDNLYDPSLPNFYCRTKRFIDVDLVGSVKVNPHFTFYVNVINLFDAKAPLNPANYAAVNYNPTWSQAGIVGRFFRAGAHFNF